MRPVRLMTSSTDLKRRSCGSFSRPCVTETAGRQLLIFLGDFVAKISATHSTSDRCQGLAVASTHLIAKQSANNCTHTNPNRTILSNRCHRLLRRRRGRLLSLLYLNLCRWMRCILSLYGFMGTVCRYCNQRGGHCGNSLCFACTIGNGTVRFWQNISDGSDGNQAGQGHGYRSNCQ